MLTPAEKQAGRLFRAAEEEVLTRSFLEDPPTYTVLPVSGQYRHECPRRQGRSTALSLHEVYVRSPQTDIAEPDGKTTVPAGRFAFIFREGRCRFCGQIARSNRGRLVDASQRHPLLGRVIDRAGPIEPDGSAPGP